MKNVVNELIIKWMVCSWKKFLKENNRHKNEEEKRMHHKEKQGKKKKDGADWKRGSNSIKTEQKEALIAK